MPRTQRPTVRCPSCGALNRVDAGKVSDQRLAPVCGRCGAPLPSGPDAEAGSAPVEVTDATFADLVERATVPVLLDLWAPWCGPCRMIAPVLEEIAAEFAGRVLVAKLNVDESPAAAGRFAVRSIPLLVLLKDGREVDRLVGAHPKGAIVERLRYLIG